MTLPGRTRACAFVRLAVRDRLLPALLLIFFLHIGSVADAMATPQAPRNEPAAVTPRLGATSVTLDGPPAPVPPAVVNRDEKGRATLRAVRIDRPLTLDGRLDEEVYLEVLGAGDWIQLLPQEGERATETTELWVFFDDDNIYVSARCLDSQPGREVANEMRRDDTRLVTNESLSVIFDTFYDRRNGFFFQSGPLGTVRDQWIVDDRPNLSWDTVWEVHSARSDRGWTTEMAIPFKSLRYAGSGPQVWGFNARRVVKWKNETDYLSAVPASYGISAINRLNSAGTLVGLETPQQSINLELKPYVVSSVTTDKTAPVPFVNDLAKDLGVDFKYGVTRGLVFDATVNTDFAQIEEDVQQVNLTRFNLLFPEKRDFFLEGQGIFAFGGVGSTQRSSATSAEIPFLFFSRQIGLSRGQAVPVEAGGRLTGRVGPYSIGVLNIQTGDKPSADALSTNFSVLRLKRNVLRRSTIGMMATRRAPSTSAAATNYVGAIDAQFAFFQNVNVGGYYARTSTSTLNGRDSSYRMRFDYGGDRYGLGLEHLLIEPQFNPGIGFVRRTDFRRTYGNVRFSPRMNSANRVVRRLSWQASMDYIEDGDRTLVQNKAAQSSFGIEFHSSDVLNVEYRSEYELVPSTFTIASDVAVPAGGYRYDSARVSYNLGQQRRVSGQVASSYGSFYNGTKTDASYNGYITLHPRFALEPGVILNWVDLPDGYFTSGLLTNRVIVTPTPRMLISSLMQYNADARTLSSSVRLRWEYRPGSELFVVYSDGRDTHPRGIPEILNRSVALKVTRLFRL